MKLAPLLETKPRNLSEWLDWQAQLHYQLVDPGLERCGSVAHKMGLAKPNFTVVSIAGTNGKGSSAQLLQLILEQAGYCTGCYTSPHLIHYNERIQVGGKAVSDEEICWTFERIDRDRGNVTLTYFEFGTLAAIDIFRRAKVDIAIMEVGLGGRLDAVNILDADVALVSTIDLDHQNWLGNDRETIAVEKAGIFRPRAPVVCSELTPPNSLMRVAHELDAPFFANGRDFSYVLEKDIWHWHSNEHNWYDLPRPVSYCDYQVQNASGVLMVLQKLADRYPVSHENICAGLHNFQLPGRFQIIPGKVQTVLDVAHNKQSSATLAENLKLLPKDGKRYCLLGSLKEKDHISIFKALAVEIDVWNFIDLPSEKCMSSSALAAILRRVQPEAEIYCHIGEPRTALQSIYHKARVGDMVVVTGSFMAVGPVLASISQRD